MAWRTAALWIMAQGKDFPKSPDKIWAKAEDGGGGDNLDAILADAQSRMRSQQADERRARKGKSRVIRREE